MSAAYIEPRESAFYGYGAEERQILEVLSGRYIGANPPIPFIFRAFAKSGILQNSEGLYLLDLTERYAAVPNGSYAYAYTLVWSDEERSIDGAMEPLGPIRLWLNDEQQYRSSVIEELKPDGRVAIPLLFRKGWNTLLIEARKTTAGFGCRFGAEEGKVRILQVLAPFSNRSGSAGWVYSEPTQRPLFGEDAGKFPDWTKHESETGLKWLPRAEWTAEELTLPNLERLYGREEKNAAAYGRTAVVVPPSCRSIALTGYAHGPSKIWLEDKLIATIAEAGPFQAFADVDAGNRQLLVWSAGGAEGWGFQLEASADGKPLELKAPERILGYTGNWLYAGPLSSDSEPDIAAALTMTTTLPGKSGHVYWMVDAPETQVRPYYENSMLSNKWTVGSMTNFGRWDYPLGVTMYGLLRTGRELERPDITEYAYRHIRSCTDWYEYSLWDYEQYGFPGINHQLVLIRMLDNCGSFGSAMLEAHLQSPDGSYTRIADTIADFMLRKLERKEDGAFYRTCEGEYSANTMWADDLYMSAPFLIRYSDVTGDRSALDEAAKQFLLFRRYLFIEEQGIMSHVYDFKYEKATQVPWGRGNGWVLFSLSELLERLPANHPDREALLDFFTSMAKGVAALQSDSGLWRQVLNEPDAYEEASCTAMFVYAFARGVRFGWLKEEGPYAAAAMKGWEGLAKYAIDRQGNVHGVCSGSRYSYAPDYYMYDLRTVKNDNHGIGIMMLAGVEISRMKAGKAIAIMQGLPSA